MSEFGSKLRAGWSLACPVSGGSDTGAAPAHGFRVTKPGELHPEINEAFKADGPGIVDVVVAADEMPNLAACKLGNGRALHRGQNQGGSARGDRVLTAQPHARRLFDRVCSCRT
jgi:hypothetical protein